MYFSSHLSAGVFLGTIAKNSPLALALGLSSHALLDMVPHHDYNNVLPAILDISTGLLALRAFRTTNPEIASSIFWGAFGATIPDIEVAIKHLCPFVSFKSIYPSHTGKIRHPQRKFPQGVLVQILTIASFYTLSIIL